MSRVARAPITLPAGVEIKQDGETVTVKGGKGSLSLKIHNLVEWNLEDTTLTVKPKEESKAGWAQAGTARALLNNMVTGVSAGFEKKLQLNGVGYRAQAKGKVININVGYSHPIDYELPEGVSAESPSQTEIVLTSMDKQLLGQVAANIRSFRPPEPYKGKGIRYADEYVRRKEAKKK